MGEPSAGRLLLLGWGAMISLAALCVGAASGSAVVANVGGAELVVYLALACLELASTGRTCPCCGYEAEA